MADPIYLDYNATTPVDPAVLSVMLPYFSEHFGNPSSKRHAFGWAADEAVTVAREQVAALLGADSHEIIFTGGATEALNLALKGYAEANRRRGKHLVTVQTEHKAVLDSCRALERRGFEVTYLPVDSDGRITAEAVAAAMRDDTILVAVMWANNELGTVHPIEQIADAVHARDAVLLCDATQAVGKIPVSVNRVDMMACSAHKFYGPKGVGALYVARGERRIRLTSLVDGGGQESGLRAGTTNVAGIVGMGAAAALATELLASEETRQSGLRDALESYLELRIPDLLVNGRSGARLPNTSSLTFRGHPAADLLAGLGELALSTGSACSSGTGKPSHVLQAIGLSDADGSATVRMSLGRFTTSDDMHRACELLATAATPSTV